MFHDPYTITMAQLLAFVKAHGLDQDEYFQASGDARLADLDFNLWGEDEAHTRWVIAYAAPGSNEGWYVHIDRVDRDGKCHPLALGKFWSADAATMAVTLLTRFLLTGRPALGEPPPGG